MNKEWIIWLVVVIILLLVGFVGFIVYRRKKQYNFMLKMMKQQQKEQERVENERAIAQQRATLSSTEAKDILDALGGKSNIKDLEQHAIRIRVQVKDVKQIDEQALKTAGISGIIKTQNGWQLIVGDRAEQVAENIKQMLEQTS